MTKSIQERTNSQTLADFKRRHPDDYQSLLAACGGDIAKTESIYLEVTEDGDESGLLDALEEGRANGVRKERERCEAIIALGLLAGVKPDLIIHCVESGVDPLTARDVFSVKGRTGRAMSSTFACLMVNIPQRANGAG